MKNKILSGILVLALVCSILAVLLVVGPPMVGAEKQALSRLVGIQTTVTRVAFNYQSNLTVKGQPAHGAYDFEFRLYPEPTGSHQLGQTQTSRQVNVDQGSFAVFLEFGDVLVGESLYLEVGIRPSGSGDPFTSLTPRQGIAPALYDTDIETTAVSGEIWKLGFTAEGSSPTCNCLICRLITQTAAFRSDRGTADIYYIFPAPASPKTVQSAKFYILDRTGTYLAGDATLTLEIYDYAGTLQHTVSAATIDLQSTATGTWTSLPLSGTAANLEIVPGEFLAFHFNLTSGPAGDLDVRPMFEVEVE